MSSGATYLIAASSSTAPWLAAGAARRLGDRGAGGREVLTHDLELDGHGPSSSSTR